MQNQESWWKSPLRTAKQLWEIHFTVLAGWFLILGLETGEEKKHGFSSTLPKIGMGVQSAVCCTELITITLHPHWGFLTRIQWEGRNRYYKENSWIETKPLQSKLLFLLTTLYHLFLLLAFTEKPRYLIMTQHLSIRGRFTDAFSAATRKPHNLVLELQWAHILLHLAHT